MGGPTSDANLDELRGSVEAIAQGFIRWYDMKSKPRRTVSRVLRFLSITLVVFGGICPLVDGFAEFDFGRVGYVLLALAGGLFILDKSFGFSNSWMRFTSAEMELREALDAFRVDWLAVKCLGQDSARSEEPLRRYFQLAGNFVKTAHGIARKETELWIREFGSSLEHLEKLAKPES